MFDKIVVQRSSTNCVPYEKTVTINRQSTSDDARLLSDLEKEALKKIESITYAQLKDTQVDHAIFKMHSDLMTRSTKCSAIFLLNGFEQKVDFSVEDDGQIGIEAAKAIAREMADKIAQILFSQIYKETK